MVSEAGNSNSALNNGMLDSFKDLRLSNGLPKIDRESKKTAVMKYYEVSKLDNVDSVLEEELKVADQSLEREKEKLDLENKWEFLRREKEKQHEETMRAEIMEEQEKLVKELDRLEEEKKDREESERKLLDELERMKLLLKAGIVTGSLNYPKYSRFYLINSAVIALVWKSPYYP